MRGTCMHTRIGTDAGLAVRSCYMHMRAYMHMRVMHTRIGADEGRPSEVEIGGDSRRGEVERHVSHILYEGEGEG